MLKVSKKYVYTASCEEEKGSTSKGDARRYTGSRRTEEDPSRIGAEAAEVKSSHMTRHEPARDRI